ncbi:MAG: hypothetical protein WC787_03995 [Patescibacteria group bacterium]|jgi:hypothetical protein
MFDASTTNTLWKTFRFFFWPAAILAHILAPFIAIFERFEKAW